MLELRELKLTFHSTAQVHKVIITRSAHPWLHGLRAKNRLGFFLASLLLPLLGLLLLLLLLLLLPPPPQLVFL